MIIRVRNTLTNNAQKTFLSDAHTSAASGLRVRNTNGFSTNKAIQIGETGSELSEIQIASGTASGSISLIATTRFPHPTDTVTYNIGFDTIVFAKSTTGTAGTATAITNGTVTITPDSVFTEFDDASGAASHAYRTWFRNSQTGAESSLSDWLTSAGFSFYSLARIRERTKNKLFSAGYLKEGDDQINGWINEWLEEMNNALVEIDQSYLMGTSDVSFGSDGLGTISASDYKHLKRVWVTYDGNNFYRATKTDTSSVKPHGTYNAAHPYYSWRGDDVFEILPASAGTARISYYKRTPTLADDTDELPVSMRSYTNSFVNYALAEAYYNDDKDDKGDRYFARSTGDKQVFIKQMTPRNFTNVEIIEMSEAIYGEDD